MAGHRHVQDSRGGQGLVSALPVTAWRATGNGVLEECFQRMTSCPLSLGKKESRIRNLKRCAPSR